MASSSLSIIMTPSVCNYDVFLSFRGEDTRHSFTDHLYHKLTQAGICAFRDEEEIKRGEELKPEIEKAIKASRSSIVILSHTYATSTWCLEELVLIMEQRKVFGHFVLPIFYHVTPRDVRKQKGHFAVEKDKWKTALTEVANLSGFTLSGPETRTLKEIVDTVYNRLDRKEVHLPLYITGMNTRYKEINSWLDQPNLEFLAIYGMGGSGKTTLAKYIYNLHRRTFEYVSFVEDIGSRCKTYNDLLELQKQLLKDILGGKKRKIPGISRGTCMIEEALQMNKAFIVLDDIVERSQLIALLGTGMINARSKIIITTRGNPDNLFNFSCWRCQKYQMRLLNSDESLELLTQHAFGSKLVNALNYEFKYLAQHALGYCEGNPLALEVLGSSLSQNDTTIYWKSRLKLLGKDIDARIQKVLIKSYIELPDKFVKELFLHIACFFVGKDIDYVVKILEPDYSAICGIETLFNKSLISVSPNKKLMMHRLLQEMGKNIVRQESSCPAERSRVWNSGDSYKILRKGEGSRKVEGLTLDMKLLTEDNLTLKSSKLKTDDLKSMYNLKLLQLNFAELGGSYEYVSENLRWLCWHGFPLTTIPFDLPMANLVAIDMSYCNLEVFEPPTVLRSLHILNLKDSHNLFEIRNIFNIPSLETLILWNCYSLVYVCKSIGDLPSLTLLNMTGCKNLCNRDQMLVASSSSGVSTKQPTFSLPFSLHRLFLKDCYIESTDSFPLSFSVQPYLQYLNLCNSVFESLPCYNHLENLRVLDLSFCSRLKFLLCLPSTLAELYIYYCESLEKITFHSHRFPLQEFGYEGCINLYEIEDYIKLVPIALLDETDLGHMEWLKEHQNHEVCLVGDDELIVGRSWRIQMLYEFDIMSISLPDINDPNMAPKYISNLPYLSFEVPSCPENKWLKGINVTFKYTISGDDYVWFCKLSTTKGVAFMYNPNVFGKPESGEACIWLSYWPIGNTMDTGDIVNISIVVMNGVEVHECGASLVYSDNETLDNNMGHADILGGDLSRFQLSTGAYYLCRRDFLELMEVGRLTRDWFRILVGDTIDFTEVRGWRKTGRPKQVDASFIELKTIRCIIHGPQLEDVYNVTEMSKSSVGDKTVAFTSSLLEEGMKSGTRSEIIDEEMEEIFDKQYASGDETFSDFISAFNDIKMEESDPTVRVTGITQASDSTSKPRFGDWDDNDPSSAFNRFRTGFKNKKIVLTVKLSSKTKRRGMVKALKALQGVKSVDYDTKEGKFVITGDVDPAKVIECANKLTDSETMSVGPGEEDVTDIETMSVEPGKEDVESRKQKKFACSMM
ncbi:disease resistance protein RML1B-like [Bidens hawaiensis]|uniref:disease resistance protein RML1B-like n=1 Tax=Bidens hawaiensis TaxID=980011 RepID=UPI00404AEB11